MQDLGTAIISIVLFVILLSSILFSGSIQKTQIVTENIIIESTQEFMDTVTDRGSITWGDYDKLVKSLSSTGGTFDLFVTVNRMYSIPDSSPLSPQIGSTDNGFVKDYRPVYGLSTRDGSWLRLDNDYDISTGEGPLFLRRHDLVTLLVKQTSSMQYQTNMLRRLNLSPGLREWSLARGSRNSGNHMVENENPPIEID